MQGLIGRMAHAAEQYEVAGDAEQAEADHEHAGDRAAAEGDRERRGDAATGRFGRAHVGADRDVHADVAGQAGEDRADREADRGQPVQGEADRHEQHHTDDRDRHVLPVQVGTRTELDRRGDFLHAFVACGLGQDPADRPDAVEDGQNRTAE